jgi:tRNA nucleotidyltransferase/poly(A) polymerase
MYTRINQFGSVPQNYTKLGLITEECLGERVILTGSLAIVNLWFDSKNHVYHSIRKTHAKKALQKTLNLLDVVMVTHATRLLSSTLLNPLSSLALNAYAYVPHFAHVRAEFFEHLEKAVLGVEAPITTLLATCRQISEKVSRLTKQKATLKLFHLYALTRKLLAEGLLKSVSPSTYINRKRFSEALSELLQTF